MKTLRMTILVFFSAYGFAATMDEGAVALRHGAVGKYVYRVVDDEGVSSQSDYGKSLFVMTNSLSDIASSACTNDSAPVCRAMLGKFEMPDIGVVEAMKVMAGMSAAAIGERNIATNYANQVAMPHRNIILEFAQ